MRSRNIGDNIRKLKSCLVSDRVRSAITDNDCLRYLCSLESSAPDGWLSHDKLANALDTYYTLNTRDGRVMNATAMTGSINNPQHNNNTQFNSGNREFQHRPVSSMASTASHQPGNNHTPSSIQTAQPEPRASEEMQSLRSTPSPESRPPRLCFVCNSGQHIAKECPNRRGEAIQAQNRQTYTQKQAPSYRQQYTRPNSQPRNNQPRVFTCQQTNPYDPVMVEPFANQFQEQQQPVDDPTAYNEQETEQKEPYIRPMHTYLTMQQTQPSRDAGINNESISSIVKNSLKLVLNPDYSPLQFIKVEVADVENPIPAVIDSGAETALVNSAIFKESFSPPKVGTLKIKGIIGEPFTADLVLLHIKLPDSNSPYIPIHCAMSADINGTLILTADIVRRLIHAQRDNNKSKAIDTYNVYDDADLNIVHSDAITHTHIDDVNGLFQDSIHCDEAADQSDEDSTYTHSDDVILPDCLPDVECLFTLNTPDNTNSDAPSSALDTVASALNQMSDSDNFREQQKSDPSLSHCWLLSKSNRSGYFVENDLLYHQQDIKGQTVHQLVVPTDRVPALLAVAHNVTHSSARRLRQRLSFSFQFPRMKTICNDFVQRCDTCQKRRRITYLDRTPIKAIDRTPLPFASIHIDILGPLCANRPMTHNFCLLAVDNHSRYPFAILMRRVTASTVCDALLDIFSHTSLPLTLSSDNASVLSSGLNREFLKRLSVSPIFISPLHSAGNGLAERHIGTLKSLISKAAFENPQ